MKNLRSVPLVSTSLSRAVLAVGIFVGLTALLGPLGKMHPAAHAGPQPRSLPAVPASGEMGFIVSSFGGRIVPGEDACPSGTVPRLREFLFAHPP